jgi:ribonuclease HI
MQKKYTIYTDGGSRGNPGIGGWGAYITFTAGEHEVYGSEKETTNNRMELMAAIKALTYCDDNSHVVLNTDSTYVRDGITQWINNWKRNGWRTAAKKPVKNQDLWMLLDEQVSRHSITWNWVKGHAGDDANERADQLCNKAMDEHEQG